MFVGPVDACTHTTRTFSFAYPQRPHKASDAEMKKFHTEDYVDFLLNINPDNMDMMSQRMKEHNVGFVGQYDCPVFDGIFPFCQLQAGGSLDGAAKLIDGRSATPPSVFAFEALLWSNLPHSPRPLHKNCPSPPQSKHGAPICQ